MKIATTRFERFRLFSLIGVLMIAAAAIVLPLSLRTHAGPARQGVSAERSSLNSQKSAAPIRAAAVMRSFAPFSESIATYAWDCSTPRTVFAYGETVCAITDGVDLSFPGGRWVNWILLNPATVVSGGQGQADITTNPQVFRFKPTISGNYKVSIAQTGDISQTPADFTVQDPPIITYASDCVTRKTVFDLQAADKTVCAKVTGGFAGQTVIWSN